MEEHNYEMLMEVYDGFVALFCHDILPGFNGLR